jgi:hypothetical protein
VPPRMRSLFPRIDEVIAARLAAWASFKASLTESDPAKRAALAEDYTRKNDEVAARERALDDEAKRLSP